jgi:uncharacterized membrane protein YfcA
MGASSSAVEVKGFVTLSSDFPSASMPNTISMMPVGLAIYWAWRNRGWTAATKLTGFVAGVGGALLGAWLGFHAGTDLLALVTAFLGAIAGANLALVVLDIARDRKARDRFAYAEPGGAGGITGEVSVGRSSGR